MAEREAQGPRPRPPRHLEYDLGTGRYLFRGVAEPSRMNTPDTPLVRLENQGGMVLVLTYADGDQARAFMRDLLYLDRTHSWLDAIKQRLERGRRGAPKRTEGAFHVKHLVIAVVSFIALLSCVPVAEAVPPHAHPAGIGGGLWECDRGYAPNWRAGSCVLESETRPGPEVIISTLPSAGEGSASPRACASGGCAAPVVQTFVVERPYVVPVYVPWAVGYPRTFSTWRR